MTSAGPLLTVLFAASVLYAGDYNLADFSRVMRRWGVDEGLRGSRIEEVAQLPDGHLLVGSEDGLFRFNGRKFELIDVSKPSDLGNKSVGHVCAEKDGIVWLQGYTGVIGWLAGDRFHQMEKPWPDRSSLRWCPHPEGGAIVSVLSTGQLYFARATTNGVKMIAGPFNADATAIHVARDRRIWIGLRGQPVAELHGNQLIKDATGTAVDTGRFLEKRDGTLLAFTKTGIYERVNDGWQPKEQYEKPWGEYPSFAVEDRDGRVWFGSRQSDRQVWDRDGSLRKLRTGRDSLPAVIQSVIVDADGDIWFSSFSGLFQARYKSFITWKPPVQMPTERVINLAVRPDRTVWFSGFGGICRLSPGSPGPEFVVARPSAEIAGCDADEAGNVLIIGNGVRFLRRDDGREIPIAVRGGESNPFTTSLAMDNDGIAWFSSSSQLYRCDPRKTPLEFFPVPKDELPAKRCHQIRLTASGDLLAVSMGDGVFVRDHATGRWTLGNPADDSAAAEIELADRDASGRIWGFNRRQKRIGCWGPESGQSLTIDRLGIVDENICGITVDDVGGLWLATRNRGVATARCDDLLAAMSDPAVKPKLKWFDTSNGLGSKGGSFTSSAMRKGPGGRIWVCTDGGLSVVDPRQWLAEKERAVPPVVHVQACLADDQPLALSEPVRVAPGTASLDLRFATLSFGFPGEVEYRHRLNGHEDAWSAADSGDTATYQHLKPGDYTFEVAAANRFGIWNPDIARLHIVVLPFWWQRLNVQIAIGLGFLLVLGLVTQARMNVLQRRATRKTEFSRQLIASQEEERRRIARELHDSLGQNLLVVKNLSMIGGKQASDEKTGRQFKDISDSAGRALEEVRAISRALRPPELDRLGISDAIRAMLDRTAESASIAIDADLDALKDALSPDQEIAVFRILQEALNNVVKYAGAKKVRVNARRDAAHLRLMIVDDGSGFDPTTVPSGVGLRSMTERAELIGAALAIESARGAGTRITLGIPHRKNT